MNEWIRCKPWIAAALESCFGVYTMDSVEKGIAAGRLQFWAGKQCAVVTEIIQYPDRKTLNYFLVGGDLKELVDDMEPRVTHWAKHMGCTLVTGIGRRGFERAFEKSGYKFAYVVIAKEI